MYIVSELMSRVSFTRNSGSVSRIPAFLLFKYEKIRYAETIMAMIQVFGVKNCRNTQKAERFFKERRVPFQFIDLADKGMSKGELQSVKISCSLEELIDRQGKAYKKANLVYMDFDIEEKLLENPLLFKTPVVRKADRAVAGYAPDVWESFID